MCVLFDVIFWKICANPYIGNFHLLYCLVKNMLLTSNIFKRKSVIRNFENFENLF